jgi:NO-binding membrane sensor protein with MHYT domain
VQPLTVITGILLGTTAAIAAGLSVVLLLFFILVDDHPQLAVEFAPLKVSTAIFLLMTVICATSFLGLVKQRRWRWFAQTGMWIGLGLTVMYYLP